MWTRQCLLIVAALAFSSLAANAQVIKTIKEHATKKVNDRKKAADSTIVRATDKAVDSTLLKASRPLDTLVGRGSAVIDTTLNRTGDAVSAGLGRLTGDASGSDHIAADLGNGRVSLPELRFVERTSMLDSASMPILRRVAAALGKTPGSFLVEGHVVSSGDAAADMSLAEHRAVAVKTALVALGVPSDRLFAMGFGAAQTPNGTSERIEVRRMQ